TRKGRVWTAAGMAAVQQPHPVAPDRATPQSPQRPANSLRDDAGGEPPGSPVTQGGMGGMRGAAMRGTQMMALPLQPPTNLHFPLAGCPKTGGTDRLAGIKGECHDQLPWQGT